MYYIVLYNTYVPYDIIISILTYIHVRMYIKHTFCLNVRMYVHVQTNTPYMYTNKHTFHEHIRTYIDVPIDLPFIHKHTIQVRTTTNTYVRTCTSTLYKYVQLQTHTYVHVQAQYISTYNFKHLQTYMYKHTIQVRTTTKTYVHTYMYKYIQYTSTYNYKHICTYMYKQNIHTSTYKYVQLQTRTYVCTHTPSMYKLSGCAVLRRLLPVLLGSLCLGAASRSGRLCLVAIAMQFHKQVWTSSALQAGRTFDVVCHLLLPWRLLQPQNFPLWLVGRKERRTISLLSIRAFLPIFSLLPFHDFVPTPILCRECLRCLLEDQFPLPLDRRDFVICTSRSQPSMRE